MTKKLELNDQYKTIKCPIDKRRIEIPDRTIIKGLYLVKYKSGNNSWYFRYTNPETGRLSHIKLGGDEISLGQARAAAKKLKASISLGTCNPAAERDNLRKSLTFKEYFEDVYLPWCKSVSKPSSWCKKVQHAEKYLHPAFGSRKLSQLQRHDLVKLQNDLLNKGTLKPATINRILTSAKAILTRCVLTGHLDKSPGHLLPMLSEHNQIETYVVGQDLKNLVAAIENDKAPVIPDLIMLLLLTGARFSEARLAEKSHVNLENRSWRIPFTNSKSNKVRYIPLGNSAVELLKKVLEKYDTIYLFPSPRTSKPLNNITKSWHRIRKEAKLPKLRLHDLRHSRASHLCQSGIPLYQIQRILGHSSPIVTQRYAHLDQTTLQNASNIADDVIKKAISSKDTIKDTS